MELVKERAAAHVVDDELASIAASLSARHPDIDAAEIAELVHGVYQELAARATVSAHLVPLTLNRCRRLLAQRAAANTKGAHRERTTPKQADHRRH